MLQPNFDPTPTEVRIHGCGYVSPCRARHCLKRATLIAEKVDTAGRHVRQIELCALHCGIVIERERYRALEICDRWGRIASSASTARIDTMSAPPPERRRQFVLANWDPRNPGPVSNR